MLRDPAGDVKEMRKRGRILIRVMLPDFCPSSGKIKIHQHRLFFNSHSYASVQQFASFDIQEFYQVVRIH